MVIVKFTLSFANLFRAVAKLHFQRPHEPVYNYRLTKIIDTLDLHHAAKVLIMYVCVCVGPFDCFLSIV